MCEDNGNTYVCVYVCVYIYIYKKYLYMHVDIIKKRGGGV